MNGNQCIVVGYGGHDCGIVAVPACLAVLTDGTADPRIFEQRDYANDPPPTPVLLPPYHPAITYAIFLLMVIQSAPVSAICLDEVINEAVSAILRTTSPRSKSFGACTHRRDSAFVALVRCRCECRQQWRALLREVTSGLNSYEGVVYPAAGMPCYNVTTSQVRAVQI